MAEVIQFTLPEPTNGKTQAYQLYWHQSDDGETWGGAIDSILVSALTIDPGSGAYIWASAAADPKKYHNIRTKSALGTVCVTGATLPPRYLMPLCEIFIDLRDLELGPRSGVAFTFTPREAPKRGIVFDVQSTEHTTDSDGRLSVLVAQGTALDISSPALAGKIVSLRTDGRTFINLAHMLG